MNNNYFRITVYNKRDNLSVIFDSNGYFESLDDFKKHFLDKGCDIIDAATAETFLDGNFGKAEYDKDSMFCRAYHSDEPIMTTFKNNGVTYYAIRVNDKTYIPDKTKKVMPEILVVSTPPLTAISDKPAAVKSSIGTGGLYQHYMQVKNKNPGAIVFYRIGDFYEVLGDDASTASAMLDLTLTNRDCDLDERVPMCGVPHHAVDSHIAKLMDWGFKVVTAG